jgi:hypothetical protein
MTPARCGTGKQFDHARMLQRSLLHGSRLGVGWQLRPGTHVPVHLYRVLQLFGGEQRRVGGREGGIGQRLGVARPSPRSSAICGVNGGDHQHQRLSDLARCAGVGADHSGQVVVERDELDTAVLSRSSVRSSRTPAIVRCSSRRVVLWAGPSAPLCGQQSG